MPRVLEAFPRPAYGEARRSALPTTGKATCEEFAAPTRSMSARAIRSESGQSHNFGNSRLSVLSMRQGDSSPLSDAERESLIAESRTEDQIGCGVLYSDKLVHMTTPSLDEARALLGMPITLPPTQRAEVGAGEAGFLGCVASGPSSYFVVCEDGKILHIAFRYVEGRWEAESVKPIPEAHLGFEPRGRLRMACASTRDSLKLVVTNMNLLNVYEFPKRWEKAPGTIKKGVHSLQHQTILDASISSCGQVAYLLADGGAIFGARLGWGYERNLPEQLIKSPGATTIASGSGFLAVGDEFGRVSNSTTQRIKFEEVTQVNAKVSRMFAAPCGKGLVWVAQGNVYSLVDQDTYLICHLDDGETITTATFSPSALQALVGTNTGRVLVLDLVNHKGGSGPISTELSPSVNRPRVISVAIYTPQYCHRSQEGKNRRLHRILDKLPQKGYGFGDDKSSVMCGDLHIVQPQLRSESRETTAAFNDESTATLTQGAIQSNSMERSNSTQAINSWISELSKPQHATKKRSYSELSLQLDYEPEEPPTKMQMTEDLTGCLEPERQSSPSSPPPPANLPQPTPMTHHPEPRAEMGACLTSPFNPHPHAQHQPTRTDPHPPSYTAPHPPQQQPPSLALEPPSRVYRIRRVAHTLHHTIRMCEYRPPPHPTPQNHSHYPPQPSPVARFSIGPDGASTPFNLGRPSNAPSATSIDFAVPNPFSSPPFSPMVRPQSPTPPTPIPLERLSSNLFTCLSTTATQTDSRWEDETISRANDRLLNSLQAWIDSQRTAM